MHAAKPILVRGKPIGSGELPVICAPLVGRTADAVLAELAGALAKKPDIVEWRVDFFSQIAKRQEVVDLGRRLKAAAGGTPILFTRRSASEGGEKVAASESEIVELYEAVCASGTVDLIDYEMSNPKADVRRLREAAHENGIGIVMSYHNFKATPPAQELAGIFRNAHELGADVGKVAVMPQSLDDVLVLLQATLDASRALPIPLISMSMGAYGSLTRIAGFAFGSSLTFAVAGQSSAPGQIPIGELRSVLPVIRKAMTPGG